MNDDRQMTVHFANGTQLNITFPTQIKNSPAAVLEGMKRVLESDKLCIEAEGKLVIIPWASVTRLEVTPAPASLPFASIKGARISA